MTTTHKIAILGFGVVGGGVANLITNNKKELSGYLGCDVEIGRILDLRDFPGSPFESLITHSYDDNLNDESIDTVIEVMGGSHPAYEYTVAALSAGKNVITSNKEVVAKFGDEFLALAEKHNVSYRFEAAVGGGIPVISPMISLVGQNNITEIRGILNGTTNYILTKMFTEGESFDSALLDAQNRGYAERNPDADVLGTDACRKIAILTSLATGKLIPTDDIHTEGITRIRTEDVRSAEKIGRVIKLLGRSIIDGENISIMVAPFMIPAEWPLGGVRGVYNAVEVIGDPIGNLMFYGQGAGAGATASAVVGDLMQIMRSGRQCAHPTMVKTTDGLSDFANFSARHYIAVEKTTLDIENAFGKVELIESDSETVFVTEEMTEEKANKILESAGLEVKSRIRLI